MTGIVLSPDHVSSMSVSLLDVLGTELDIPYLRARSRVLQMSSLLWVG